MVTNRQTLFMTRSPARWLQGGACDGRGGGRGRRRSTPGTGEGRGEPLRATRLVRGRALARLAPEARGVASAGRAGGGLASSVLRGPGARTPARHEVGSPDRCPVGSTNADPWTEDTWRTHPAKSPAGSESTAALAARFHPPLGNPRLDSHRKRSRLLWAPACPWSAAKRNHRAASWRFCRTP